MVPSPFAPWGLGTDSWSTACVSLVLRDAANEDVATQVEEGGGFGGISDYALGEGSGPIAWMNGSWGWRRRTTAVGHSADTGDVGKLNDVEDERSSEGGCRADGGLCEDGDVVDDRVGDSFGADGLAASGEPTDGQVEPGKRSCSDSCTTMRRCRRRCRRPRR